MHAIDIDGIRINYQRAGNGPPIVLLHGVLGDSREWRPQLEGLSDRYTVVAWDAPGCGQSADPPDSWRIADFVSVLAHFIEALQFERPHLLGLSWGSGLALEFYRAHPQIPQTLILASAYAGWKGSLAPEEVDRRLTQIMRESELPPEEFLPGWLPQLLTPNAPEVVQNELLSIMSEFHPAGLRVMASAFVEMDARDMLGNISVPTLLLYGQEDQRSPVHVAQDLHRRIPGSTLEIFPGAGHQCNMEIPKRFNDAVARFLLSAGQ